MQDAVTALLAEAGISMICSDRGYRPTLSLPGTEVKLLKPQNIVEMLHLGSRDIGFAGADWVAELQADSDEDGIIEVLDTQLNGVRLVAAAPQPLLCDGQLPEIRLRIASEYERLTRDWIREKNLDAGFVKSNGATEVFPPEDADLIVDNTATGSTLRDNGLVIIDEIMRSSTRLYASQAAFKDAAKRSRIEDLKLLLQAVLDGRQRLMIEVNVSAEQMEDVISVLPAMQQPTVATLSGNSGYAVRAAILRTDLPFVIPRVKQVGGRDVVVTKVSQIVP